MWNYTISVFIKVKCGPL